MLKTLATCAALIALSAPGIAFSAEDHQPTTTPHSGDVDPQVGGEQAKGAKDHAVASAATVSAADREFVANAASGGHFEVKSSEHLLESKAGDDAVRDFAKMMVKDHGMADAELKALAEKKGIAVPEAMNATDRAHYDELKGLKGDALAKRYVELQTAAHQDAIALFEKASREASDSDLRAFAEKTLPTLRKHQEHVGKLSAGK